MVTIICGTNRSESTTKKIADIYSHILMEKGASSRILELKDLPQDFIFSAQFENSGKNEAFNEVQQIIDESFKFVFIVPEYNGSFPGVLKSFLDTLKFPHSFKGKVAGIVGLSSGTQGSSLAMSHLTDIFNYLGMFVLPIKPRLGNVNKILKDGQIEDKFLMDLLIMQAEQLVKFNC